jgi:hypothetical protein
VFYRGSWELGGRFHGGWWQQLPKELRQQIYINDEPTIEEDFSALHLTLLYGIEGLRLDSDPYALDVGWQRDWVKSLILVSINAKNERSAFQAFRSEQPIGSEAKHFTDLELNAVLEAFKLAHPAIAQHLCSDMGVRLMAIDGRITARVIDHFTALDVPILTIHDSVIAPYNRAIELRAVMREAAAIEASVSSIGIKNTAFVNAGRIPGQRGGVKAGQ